MVFAYVIRLSNFGTNRGVGLGRADEMVKQKYYLQRGDEIDKIMTWR